MGPHLSACEQVERLTVYQTLRKKLALPYFKFMAHRWSLEEARREVLQVASPRLPFMISTRRLIEDVLNARFTERSVQALETRAHALGFHRSHAEPQ